MEMSVKRRKLHRWGMASMAYLMGAVAMFLNTVLFTEDRNFCDMATWQEHFRTGLFYFFMWSGIYITGMFIKGEEMLEGMDEEWYKNRASKPVYLLYRDIIMIWVIIAGLVGTSGYLVSYMKNLIRSGQCRAYHTARIIWHGVYPGLLAMVLVAMGVWLFFRIKSRASSGMA